jgi:hypothetical protein
MVVRPFVRRIRHIYILDTSGRPGWADILRYAIEAQPDSDIVASGSVVLNETGRHTFIGLCLDQCLKRLILLESCCDCS